jgi:hypothetical protein
LNNLGEKMKNGFEINVFGDKMWYKDGHFHKEDGPAVEWTDGVGSWFLGDEFYGYEKPSNWDELVLKSRAKRLLDL